MIRRCSALAALGLLAFAALSITATSGRAQDEAAFFKGKTIKFIVTFGAGGGYDIYARQLAPHFAKKFGATVVVENQPGAGGLSALATFATTTPDGLTMMIINGTGAAAAQLAGQSGVRFDLGEFGYLGTVSASPWIWLVPKDSPIKTAADALAAKKQITWGAGGPMDGLSDGAAFACAALKLDCKVILGYKGSKDVALALMRNEIESLYVSDTSAFEYSSGNELRVVAVVGRKKSRFFPKLPTIFEATKVDAEGAWLLDFHGALEDLGRILVVPPKMTAARLAYMQRAVREVLTDKEVVDEGEKRQRYIDFEDANTTRDRVLKVIQNLNAEQKKRVVDLLLKT
jgi:tripartite-type tricarboxylate transporter receptor subunit TctC